MKFEEILVFATLLTGLVWLLEVLVFKRKRLGADSSYTKESWVIEYSISFFPVLLLVLVLRSFLAEPFKIPSGSMKPTLLEGDFILVNKYEYGIRLPILGIKFINVHSPKRGDVLVFRHYDRKDLIKRVVGLPGDRVQYKNKTLYINGKLVPLNALMFSRDGLTPAIKQSEQLDDQKHAIFTYPHYPNRSYEFDNVVVPANSYFVMGDNRDNSEDSRFWGFVADEKIIGRAFATWWSWEWQQWYYPDIRWRRIFKSID